MILTRSFYTRPDVLTIARELLGKFLVTRIDGMLTSGMICETEAYKGVTDRASHSFGGRRTARTETMYAIGGTAYVYLCYGVHSLFNVVTNLADIPDAVLIRGIIPHTGTDIMLKRTEKEKLNMDSGIGPGKVSKMLGIHYSYSGIDLINSVQNVKGIHLNPAESLANLNKAIWIEDRNLLVNSGMIIAGPRIGVHYAGEDAGLPYRFRIKKEATPYGQPL